VVITRNGHAASAATIGPHLWDISEQDPSPENLTRTTTSTIAQTTHPAKLAAALVLATLAARHNGFEGLCGARDWRSIGLHYIATTDYKTDTEMARQLLARALDFDLGNRPALVALQHSLHREAHEVPELRRYGEWLGAQSDQIAGQAGDSPTQNGYLDLHRRILSTWLVAVLNHRAITGSSAWPGDAAIEERSRRLVQLLADDTPRSGGLRDRMRPQAATLLDGLFPPLQGQADEQATNGTTTEHIFPPAWRQSALDSLAPATAYNVACGYVRQGQGLQNPEVHEKFERAFALERLKKWARTDPELVTLHSDAAFRELVGLAPRTSFWQLDLFAPHRKKLTDAGVTDPGRLQDRDGDNYLRRYLGLARPVYTHLTRVARLIKRAEEVSWANGGNIASRYQVEIVAELIERGIEVPADIHPAWVTPGGPVDPTVVAGIAKAVHQRTWQQLDQRQLTEWLRLVRGTP
jgi:hypothetical protein